MLPREDIPGGLHRRPGTPALAVPSQRPRASDGSGLPDCGLTGGGGRIRASGRSSPLLIANPAIVGPDPRILVLGSFPGPLSLEMRQYYAHPRNAFWAILGALCGFDAASPYPDRVAALLRAGVAVWDVVERCRRDGSEDSAITEPRPADVPGLLATHPGLGRVVINGKSVARLYRLLIGPLPGCAVVVPSTSPAHARMTLAEKTEAWREALRGSGVTLAEGGRIATSGK